MIKPLFKEMRATIRSAFGHSLGVLTLTLGATLILAGLTGSGEVEANRAPIPVAVPLEIPEQSVVASDQSNPQPADARQLAAAAGEWRGAACR